MMRNRKRTRNSTKDPDYDFYVGRLLGASEVISHWLSLQEDTKAQEMGRSLAAISGWFFKDGQSLSTEITQILPPK